MCSALGKLRAHPEVFPWVTSSFNGVEVWVSPEGNCDDFDFVQTVCRVGRGVHSRPGFRIRPPLTSPSPMKTAAVSPSLSD